MKLVLRSGLRVLKVYMPLLTPDRAWERVLGAGRAWARSVLFNEDEVKHAPGQLQKQQQQSKKQKKKSGWPPE